MSSFENRLRMVYQRADAAGNYQVYLAESEDGFSFQDVMAEPVLRPLKEAGIPFRLPPSASVSKMGSSMPSMAAAPT